MIDLLGPRHVPALVAYRRLTEDYFPWIEQRLVRRARDRGSTWADIGRTLHRTRQSVHRKFARLPTMGDMLPPRRLVDRDCNTAENERSEGSTSGPRGPQAAA